MSSATPPAIEIIKLPTGLLSVNTYLVVNRGAEGGAVVIDPGGDAPKIARQLGAVRLAAVLLTHSHYDHLGGVNELLALYPTARFLCHPQCARAAADAKLNYSFAIAGEKYAVTAPAEPLADGAEFSLAGTTWRADFVPGHTADSLCFYLAAASALFSGDTVFAGSIGRDDLDGGDGELLIAGIKRLLGALPPDTRIFSGHGAETTAARELRDNPFLR